MPRVEFDGRTVSTLRLPPDVNKIVYTDRRYRGLQLQLRWLSGKARIKNAPPDSYIAEWCYRFQAPDKKRSQVKLGEFPEKTLAWAVAEVRRLNTVLESGVDPRSVLFSERAEEMRASSTPAELLSISPRHRIENVLAQMEEYWPLTGKSMRTFEKYKRDIVVHVLPRFRGRDIRSITPFDWDELILQIANVQGKPGAASNVHKAGRRLFNFATQKELIQANPLLQRKQILESVRLDEDTRFFESEELHKFLTELPEQKTPEWVKVTLFLMLRVGVRIEEWQRVKIGWVRLKSMRIEHPGEAMKNRRLAWTHLTDDAIGILITWLKQYKEKHGKLDPDWYLFPDKNSPTKMNPIQLSDETRYLREWMEFAPKMIRKTISTHLQRKGCPPTVLRAIRNQKITEGVEDHYDFDDLFHMKKEWIERWGKLLTEVQEKPRALLTDRESQLSHELSSEVDELFK